MLLGFAKSGFCLLWSGGRWPETIHQRGRSKTGKLINYSLTQLRRTHEPYCLLLVCWLANPPLISVLHFTCLPLYHRMCENTLLLLFYVSFLLIFVDFSVFFFHWVAGNGQVTVFYSSFIIDRKGLQVSLWFRNSPL